MTGCNFTKNKATGNYSYGGAVHFSGSGIVINSNFDYNIASEDGGAINMVSGTVSNCNFVNNSANSEGGAIRMYSGTVTDCNFVNNSAKIYGGAVFFGDIGGNGKMSNCIFTNNKVTGEDSRGGAVYFLNKGDVSNCIFSGNIADNGVLFSVGKIIQLLWIHVFVKQAPIQLAM